VEAKNLSFLLDPVMSQTGPIGDKDDNDDDDDDNNNNNNNNNNNKVAVKCE